MGDNTKRSMKVDNIMYDNVKIYTRDNSISGLNEIELFLDNIKKDKLLPLISIVYNDTSNQIFLIELIKGIELEGIIYDEIEKICNHHFECQHEIRIFNNFELF